MSSMYFKHLDGNIGGQALLLLPSPSQDAGVALTLPPFPLTSPILGLLLDLWAALLLYPTNTSLTMRLLSPFRLTPPLLVLVLDSYAALLLSPTSTSSTIELMSAIPFEIGLDCPSTSVFFVQALVQHVLLGSKCCYFFLVIMLFL